MIDEPAPILLSLSPPRPLLRHVKEERRKVGLIFSFSPKNEIVMKGGLEVSFLPSFLLFLASCMGTSRRS